LRCHDLALQPLLTIERYNRYLSTREGAPPCAVMILARFNKKVRFSSEMCPVWRSAAPAPSPASWLPCPADSKCNVGDVAPSNRGENICSTGKILGLFYISYRALLEVILHFI
jgi:hypothetical protein